MIPERKVDVAVVGRAGRVAAITGLAFLAAMAGWLGFALYSWGLEIAASVAGVVSVLLALIPVAIPLVRLLRQISTPLPPTTEQMRQAQKTLADQVKDQWTTEYAVLDLEDKIPMPVRWNLASHVVRHAEAGSNTGADRVEVMDHERNVGDSSAAMSGRSDQIGVLVTQFQNLRRRRLVILGGPGAGKTTLAIQLLLEMLKSRQDDEPVPVLLSLAGWDTRTHRRLPDWLAAQLAERYPVLRSGIFGSDAPQALARRALVVPILDGLDELAGESQVAVLAALNAAFTEDDQLIITCRTTEYADTVKAAGNVLTAAAVIQPDPLTPADAHAYLATCLPRTPNDSWQTLLDVLRRGTTSPLASALSTPLGLWLLRAVYPTTTHANPTPLLDTTRFPDPQAVQAHLLEQLIPALIDRDRERSIPTSHRWDASDVRRWLGYLAYHLKRVPSRDFAWWHLARHTLPTLAVWLTLWPALGLALVATVVFGFKSAEGPLGGLTTRLGNGLVGAIAGGLVVGFGGGITLWLSFANSSSRWLGSEFGFVDTWIRTILRRRVVGGLIVGLAFGLVGGITVGVAAGVTVGLAFGLISGFTFGVASGLTFGLAGELIFRLIDWTDNRARSSTPRSTARADRTLNIISASVVVLTFWLAFGLVVGLTFGLAQLFSSGLAGRTSQSWVSYALATTRLAMTRRLPLRLMTFLDDAHHLGLLRTAGPVYQFRHADLHDHLAATYRS